MKTSRLLLLIFASPLALSAQEMSMSSSETLSPEHTEFFESKIRPALIKHCYKCHAEEGDKVKGGLLLDTRASSQSGGDSGPAVVPFDLNESLLITAIRYEDSTLEMPPKYKLDADVIADFEKWIEMGAPDPRERRSSTGAPEEYTNTIDLEEGRKHWAYQVPVKPRVPEISTDGAPVKSPIDAFVRQKREEAGFDAPASADAQTILRRLYFDLVGLPPSPEEVKDFVRQYEKDADASVSGLVDRLLETDQFGERWGRRWLDVARYGESSGKETNATFPHAWRYRDYVIDSFNEDKPINQFIIEQLAGDLLDAENEEDAAENVIATGFLAIGTKGLNEQNARQFRFDLVDEQIDTTTQAFLGTTAACARCHDHKFDPIPMSDYYSLAGIFLSSNTMFGTAEALQNRKATELIPLPDFLAGGFAEKSMGELIDLEMQLDMLQERLDELNVEARAARREGDNDRVVQIRQQSLGLRNRVGINRRILAGYNESGKAIPVAMGMQDHPDPFDAQILIRGEEDNPTEGRVPRGFLQVIKTHDEEPIPSDESGRLQMAHWITSPENPLTSRVFVNRVWSWMFGEGIVRSVDNFGTTGEAPTHPELLDYLAVRFHELDWSVKDLVREIANSDAYRMSSEHNDASFEKDPENTHLWRFNKRRLDAEAIRDATLSVSGKLDPERPDGSLVSRAGDGFVGRNIQETELNAATDVRSVYLPIVRGLVPESLALFDFADPSLLSGKREITTVPSQALYMMNSNFII
ncbi:MAG: PSD1 and planctomycete cytochrome C domain-containing protein, partial [Verrucomicrobiales bacterium]|nr:PSD1 and planctomycete cytochrome C domain-containing protein [Verrucomicrobiales bacterium]